MNYRLTTHLISSRTRDAREAMIQSPKLDVQVRKLCNRLASETHRKAIWNTAARLRELCKEKLLSGATKDELCLWLNEEHNKIILGDMTHVNSYIDSSTKKL